MSSYKCNNITPFDGNNFITWRTRVRGCLRAKGLLDIVDQENPENPNPNWIKRDNAAKYLIQKYLADSHMGYAESEDVTAKEIFNSLNETYDRKSQASQMSIKRRLMRLKLEGETTLNDHFIKFENLISELSSAGAHTSENDKCTYLLESMPDSYESMKTALTTISDDDINLPFIKNKLLDHETTLKQKSQDTSNKVLIVNNKMTVPPSEENKRQNNFGKFSRRGKFNRRGSYNRNRNFTPNNFKFQRGGRKNFSKYECFQCGRKGHKKQDCYYFKREQNYFKNKKESEGAVNLAEQVNQDSGFSTSYFNYKKS